MISVGNSDQRERKREQGQIAAFYSSATRQQDHSTLSKGQLPTYVKYS